jgi:hypothetical protein
MTSSSYRGFVISLYQDRLSTGELTPAWVSLIAGQAIFNWLLIPLKHIVYAMRNVTRAISKESPSDKALRLLQSLTERVENLYECEMPPFQRTMSERPDPSTTVAHQTRVIKAIRKWSREVDDIAAELGRLTHLLPEHQWLVDTLVPMLAALQQDMVEVLAALDE